MKLFLKRFTLKKRSYLTPGQNNELLMSKVHKYIQDNNLSADLLELKFSETFERIIICIYVDFPDIPKDTGLCQILKPY